MNAIISKVRIFNDENKVLTAFISLNFGAGFDSDFGGEILYTPNTMTSIAGHFIWRVMQIAGVDEWEKLVGRPVRVVEENNIVVAIGHFLKEEWFYPATEFKLVLEAKSVDYTELLDCASLLRLLSEKNNVSYELTDSIKIRLASIKDRLREIIRFKPAILTIITDSSKFLGEALNYFYRNNLVPLRIQVLNSINLNSVNIVKVNKDLILLDKNFEISVSTFKELEQSLEFIAHENENSTFNHVFTS